EGDGVPRELAEAAFGKWAAEKKQVAVKWEVIDPVDAASGVPRLEILQDGSVLASGDQTKSDVYEVVYEGDFSGVTGVRLEALPDERLPAGGPGRTFYEGRKGDFFLSEFDVAVAGEDVAIATGKENFGKLAIGGGASTAQLTLDGDAQTGWSASGREGKPSGAVFVFVEPLEGSGMSVRLLFEKHYSVGLGRFRVSVTRDVQVGRGEVLPAEVEAALVDGGGREVLWDYWVSVVPELVEARKRVAAVRAEAPEVPTTLVMRERAAEHPRVTRRHHRGEWLQAEEAVGVGLPAVFKKSLGNGESPKDRLEFARWLVSRENPLTARVVANRAWQAFFGRGLVKTVEDFGFQGELPSHPELLDWLASELMDSGWDLKRLQRTIVTSATYRQASVVTARMLEDDPENIYLGRAPRVRLEAELVRDSALAASGLLARKVGGPSVFPPQPASVTTDGAYGRLTWKVSQGEDRWRRSLYTYAKRTTPFAMGITFDGPTGEACVARREVSNTPLQALTLMNDTVFLECAQKLGGTLAGMDGEDGEKVRWLWKRCLTREAGAGEVEDVLMYLKLQRVRLQNGGLRAKEISGGGNAERAAWALVARVVLNLDEMIVKQ
ncbi:MAG: DUF1553 domain-containing protein, partial [Verrucomicrobiales bacterium]|nr:DUF1553 domain-containing protein [Verrucomicrobiales bacterium]